MDGELISRQPIFESSLPTDDSQLNFSELLISRLLIHLMCAIPISPPANFLPRKSLGAKQSANPTPKCTLTTAPSTPLCSSLSWKTLCTPNHAPFWACIPRGYWHCVFGHLHPRPCAAAPQQPGTGPASPGLGRGLLRGKALAQLTVPWGNWGSPCPRLSSADAGAAACN